VTSSSFVRNPWEDADLPRAAPFTRLDAVRHQAAIDAQVSVNDLHYAERLVRLTHLDRCRVALFPQLIFSKRNAECVVTTASGAKLIAGVPASSRVAGPIDDPSGPNTLKTTLQFKLLEVNTLGTFVV